MPTDPTPKATPAATARALIRGLDRASLGTLTADGAAPYVSLVLVACDQDATPLLLISRLAEHTRNIATDASVSLLFDGTVGLDSPLTGARVSVQGRAAVSSEPRHRARFLARHPEAAQYVDFGDFSFFAVEVEWAHMVAGFGAIHRIAAHDLLPEHGRESPLAEAEASIVGHMNEDHADAIQLYATRLLGAEGEGWRMTGIDPEGCDLRRGGTVLRLPFLQPIRNGNEARATLIDLVKRARSRA
ncbi:MAG: DUF2470 domain-containing protein [Alphaproteobacteria bacterium]